MSENLSIGNNLVTAKQTVTFADAGITEDNCLIIYENRGGTQGYKSFVPGRGTNPLLGFTIYRQYLIIMKQAADLSAIVTRPFTVKYPINLANVRIIGDGNSYMEGNGTATAFSFLAQLTPFNTNGASFVNLGVGSQNTPMMIADQATQVFPLFQTGKLNILIVEEGGNDVGAFGNVANAVENMRTYCNNAKSYCNSLGIPLFIIISTKIRREQTPGDSETVFNQKLVQYNEQTLADDSYYDAIIRPELESIFLTYTAGGYKVDHIHPNDTGQAKYAALYKSAILGLTTL